VSRRSSRQILILILTLKQVVQCAEIQSVTFAIAQINSETEIECVTLLLSGVDESGMSGHSQ
jgi:hypothetical protein